MITAEELLERILILTTVNSTLIHALISLEAEEDVGSKQVRQLAKGVRAVRDSVKQTLAASTDEKTSGSSFVDDTISVILQHLNRIQKALGKLAKNLETKQALVGVTTDARPSAAIQRQMTETARELEDLTGKPFQRRLSILDPEKRLVPIQQLLDRYSSTSHLLLPHFWFEACQELFRYSEPRTVVKNVAQIASGVFHDLIRRFLSEAPCSGLLQEILRRSGTAMELTNSERNQIIENARDFYNRLAESLKEKSPKQTLTDAKRILRDFDWGPPDVEKRVVGTFFRSARELLDRANDAKGMTMQERIIHAELTRYICDLTATLHQLPRFHRLLAEMK